MQKRPAYGFQINDTPRIYGKLIHDLKKLRQFTNIPVVYPYKYEGAQMLSLYKHPAQTVWFLKNWKSIREGLEGGAYEDIVELDDSVADFDL